MAETGRIYRVKNFIKVIEKGKLSITTFRALLKKIISAAVIYKDHNLLLDFRGNTPLDDFNDVLTLIIELTKFNHIFHKSIAVVIDHDPERIERIKFFKAGLEPVSFQFEYFTDFEDAINWLSDIHYLQE